MSDFTECQKKFLIDFKKEFKKSSLDNPTFYGLFGGAGVGKLLPNDEPVLTMDGFVKNGDLKVGDLVINDSGTESKIIGTYPDKNLEMYKITFSDNSTVRCCIDHLWKVQTTKLRGYGKYKIIPLSDMLENIQKRKNIKQCHYYSIPLTNPVEFKKQRFKICPYLLGYILGDGCSSRANLMITCWYKDYSSLLSNIDKNVILSVRENKKSNCKIISIRLEERKYYEDVLKLKRLKSMDKFVPENYLMGNVEQRKLLLAGLIDSDGSCVKNRASFCSNSKKLVQNVIWLVRSLGGTAKECNVDIRNKNILYSCTFRLDFNPFKLKRKALGYTVTGSDKRKFKSIISAEKIDNLDGQCILLEDGSGHLYLTNDFTVTHNTYLTNEINKKYDCAITAPTHKALAVIRNKIGTSSKYSTIHSYANCRIFRDGVEKILSAGKYSKSSTERMECDVLIVDECSMLSSFMVERIFQLSTQRIFRMVLFIGDPSQLPPVKDGNCSESFTRVSKYTILTEIVRQERDNPLITFATKIRNSISSKECKLDIKSGTNISKKGIFYGNSVDKYLSGYDNYLENPNYIRTLAWRNARVDELNTKIRAYIFGEQLSFENTILKNDLLVANGSVYVSEVYENSNKLDETACTIGANSDEFLVNKIIREYKLDIQVDNYSLTSLGLPKLEVIEAGVKNISSGFVSDIFICNSDITKILEKLVILSKKNKNIWQLYYKVESISNLKHGYAVTVHKSQGSTFKNVIVDLSDIRKNNKRDEKLKLLYVGVTRCERACVLI